MRALVRVPGCLVLAVGLLAGAAGAANGSAAPAAAGAKPPQDHVVIPLPPGAIRPGPPTLNGSVTPADTEVPLDGNGDFTLTVVNTGGSIAQDVRVLVDSEQESNPVGSSDGRCLSRSDTSSPADLWCELGDLEPRQSASVKVHAFMSLCVRDDPRTFAPRSEAPAFTWRITTADGQASPLNGPSPHWSCVVGRHLVDLGAVPGASRR